MEPLFALVAAAAVGTIAVVMFWPERGLFWRGGRLLRDSARVRVEDALKHIYDCEYRRLPCTLLSLSGALGISGDRAAELVGRLEQMELVRSGKGGLQLTPAGRRDALQVIRVHRLWERYLSERTSLGASEWHSEADRREHSTSPEQAAALAAEMLHPRFDPHGDPIPTAPGEMIPFRGEPLTTLPIDKIAQIVHIEDEPQAIHAQLAALGLYPGMRVRVIETGPHCIRFEANAEEHVLVPVVASNLWVVPLPDEQEMTGPFENLSSLKRGARARVAGISPLCRGAERRRLLDLGVTPGTLVEAELAGPGEELTAYRIRGALIALRREQAGLIHVELAEKGTAT